MGGQPKPMGVKVHYTFDKESQDRCLARVPNLTTVLTYALDDQNTIGFVDLRPCLQCVTQCSPELVGTPGSDYVVYAYDYSEPDAPLVGQGMLSRLLDSEKAETAGQQQNLNMVTGRVTKNMFANFNTNAIKDILEVKLKLVVTSKIQKPEQRPQMAPEAPMPQVQIPQAMQQQLQQAHHPQPYVQRPQSQASNTHMNMSSQSLDAVQTPSAEWSFLMEANPQLGHEFMVGGLGSPPHVESGSNTPAAVAPQPVTQAPSQQSKEPRQPGSRPSSRPSSRASRKSRQPTGKPRGRPPKRLRPDENTTSGYEDGTDGDDGPVGEPAKKRVATTRVDNTINAPFASAPDSLRVAASTSGSLRTFRPVAGTAGETRVGSHLQDAPRAPTPIPGGSVKGRGRLGAKSRRQSTLSQEPSIVGNAEPSSQPHFSEARLALSPPNNDDDGRSPPGVFTPVAFSDDSAPEIGSSPPVPRPFLRDQSSPPPSSPILPPMPPPTTQVDSGFMSGGIDDSTANVGDVKMQDVNAPADTRAPRRPRIEREKVPVHIFRLHEGRGGNQDMVPVSSPFVPVPISSDAAPVLPPLKRPRTQSRAASALIEQPSERCSSLAAEQPATTGTEPPKTVVSHGSRPDSKDDDGPTPQPKLPPPPKKPSRSRKKKSQPQAPPDTLPATAPTPVESAPDVPKSTDTFQPPPSRHRLSRSESSGALALPTPTSEPTPPTALPLPRAASTEEALPLPTAAGEPNPPLPMPLPRAASTEEALPLPTAAGEPNLPMPMPLPRAASAEEARPSNSEPSKRASPPTSLPLPSLPVVPASDPVGPAQPAALPLPLPRAASTEEARPSNSKSSKRAPPPASLSLPSLPAVPASDPVGPAPQTSLPNATSFSEAPCPPSDAGAQVPPTSPPAAKSSKNYVKKQTIKDRLERAVMNGEMPPYCANCGAIETPTWRKISTREFKGVPEYVEYSEKPGRVTAIEVLTRDEKEKPTSYRLVKKALGADDDKKLWTEKLLCNPCGIWLSKYNNHRPQERWNKDQDRLGQERRRRGTGRAVPRKKKPMAKDTDPQDPDTQDPDTQGAPAPTSEACFHTDAPAGEATSPNDTMKDDMDSIPLDQLNALLEAVNSQDFSTYQADDSNPQATASGRSGFSDADSTRTRGNGTVNSPITLDFEEDMGSTRRLLFPSPKQHKDRNALAEKSPNIITPPGPGAESESHDEKDLEPEPATATVSADDQDISKEDEYEHLFRSPVAPARPSTPPPNAASTATENDSAFKTPSRPTPSHRPVTRSVSRSIRSVPRSPTMLRTPSRTPRAIQLLMGESPTLRRSPRINRSGSKSQERERRIRGIADMPVDSDMMMGLLGQSIQDPFSDQAELDAILDKCLSSWSDFTPRRGEWNSDLNQDWDMEQLERHIAEAQPEETS